MPTLKTLMPFGVAGPLAERLDIITGTFTLTEATPVVVAQTGLTADKAIVLTTKTPAGTPGWYGVTARTNGTGFSVTGTAGDTSVVQYLLVDIR